MLDDAVQERELEYTPAVARESAPLYERVKRVVSELDWTAHAPYIVEINRLKKVRDAVILAHNYMTPEIYHCVADFTGDSLQLAQQAADTDAGVIVQAGVHFMAETAKVLSPDKTVLIPDLNAGCSLASSITGADVRLLREQYPGVPVVTYVNTSADVKAESDICCTSSNARRIVDSLESDTVIMLPDRYLAQNVARETRKRIITWRGTCIVHEKFTPADIVKFRAAWPGIVVLAHPECPPDVAVAADFVGSTKAMSDYVEGRQPSKVVMLTECSMADNLAASNPGVDFVRPCQMCPHMGRISLPKILDSLETMTHEVVIDADVADRARLAVERMLDASR